MRLPGRFERQLFTRKRHTKRCSQTGSQDYEHNESLKSAYPHSMLSLYQKLFLNARQYNAYSPNSPMYFCLSHCITHVQECKGILPENPVISKKTGATSDGQALCAKIKTWIYEILMK